MTKVIHGSWTDNRQPKCVRSCALPEFRGCAAASLIFPSMIYDIPVSKSLNFGSTDLSSHNSTVHVAGDEEEKLEPCTGLYSGMHILLYSSTHCVAEAALACIYRIP